MTVRDVVGLRGGGIAGVLYTGTEMLHDHAVGGFGARVDSDPFSITTEVKAPGPEFRGLFPYVSEEALELEPGRYTLILWADDVPLLPYGRWAPSEPDSGARGMYFCQHTFDVGASDLQLSIAGVPTEPSTPSPTITRCAVD